MELRKTNESSNRNYDAEGNVTSRSEYANYTLIEDGKEIGNASINVEGDNGSASVTVAGVSSMTEGEAKLKSLLGISE